MKQKRKVTSLISKKIDRGVIMTTLLFILGGALCLGAITLSLFTSSVSAVSMMQLPYTGMDDNREVLYDLEFIKANDYSSHEDNMKMKGSTFVISSKPIIINSLGYAGVINRSNEVNYGVYGNILGGNYNKISSENVTVIAGEYNEVNIGNDNAVVLGGKNNKIYSGSSLQGVLVGGSWNRIKDSEGVNSIIGGGNNIISGASNVNILGGNRNTVVEGEDVIIGGSNVQVWSDLKRSFIFSDGRGSFSPTVGYEGSNTFYLNVENGVGINALSNGGGVNLGGAMFIGEINIDSLRCTSSDLGVEGVWNGCLVGCTQFSHNLTEGWELLSQGDKCESLCEGSSRCVSISSVEDLSDTYASSCSKGQISNTNNAIMCSEAALGIYENVIFETSLIDSEEDCPAGDNKCVYQCVKGSHLTGDTTGRGYGVGCFRDCELRWSTGDYIRHNQQSTGENGVYLCVDGTLNLSGCLNGYHTEDYSTCVSNTKQEQCIQSGAPEHAHYKSQLVNVTWNGGWDYGSWTQPSICGWECDSDYHLSSDGKKCEFNHKTVQCQTGTKPENSEYIITTDWIEWNAQPSVCAYECNAGYVMSGAMGATGTVCVSGTVETYKCYGINYYGATLVSGSNENLTSNGSYVLYNSYEEAKDHKCAYYCPAGKIKMGDYCAKKINMCKGEMPSNSVVNNVYPDNDSTYYYYSGSEAPCAFICEEGYVYVGNITTGSVASTGTCVFAGTYSCQGVMPQGAKLLKGSDSGLTGNVNKTLYESVDKARGHKCAYYCDEGYSYKVKSNGESTCEKQQIYACVGTYPSSDDVVVNSTTSTHSGTAYSFGNGECSFTCKDRSSEGLSFHYQTFDHGYFDTGNVWHKTPSSGSGSWIGGCAYQGGYASCYWLDNVNQNHTVLGNSNAPSTNTAYYYSPNTSDVCTFTCESGYVYTGTTLSGACVSGSVEPKRSTGCTGKVPDNAHLVGLGTPAEKEVKNQVYKDEKTANGKYCAYVCNKDYYYVNYGGAYSCAKCPGGYDEKNYKCKDEIVATCDGTENRILGKDSAGNDVCLAVGNCQYNGNTQKTVPINGKSANYGISQPIGGEGDKIWSCVVGTLSENQCQYQCADGFACIGGKCVVAALCPGSFPSKTIKVDNGSYVTTQPAAYEDKSKGKGGTDWIHYEGQTVDGCYYTCKAGSFYLERDGNHGCLQSHCPALPTYVSENAIKKIENPRWYFNINGQGKHVNEDDWKYDERTSISDKGCYYRCADGYEHIEVDGKHSCVKVNLGGDEGNNTTKCDGKCTNCTWIENLNGCGPNSQNTNVTSCSSPYQMVKNKNGVNECILCIDGTKWNSSSYKCE